MSIGTLFRYALQQHSNNDSILNDRAFAATGASNPLNSSSIFSESPGPTENQQNGNLKRNHVDSFNCTADSDRKPAAKRSRSYRNQWMLRFNELKRYKSEHGDCAVPQNYAENQQLANCESSIYFYS